MRLYSKHTSSKSNVLRRFALTTSASPPGYADGSAMCFSTRVSTQVSSRNFRAAEKKSQMKQQKLGQNRRQHPNFGFTSPCALLFWALQDYICMLACVSCICRPEISSDDGHADPLMFHKSNHTASRQEEYNNIARNIILSR